MKTFGKMLLAIFVGFLAVNLLFGGKGDKNADISTRIKDGALIVDTRTKGEFERGHVTGALNIPYDVITDHIAEHQKDKSKPIIVYCRSGNRSSHAKRALVNAGYTNVIDAGSLGNMQSKMPK